VPSHHDHAIGEAIGIRLAADHVVVFPRAGADTTRVGGVGAGVAAAGH